MLSVLNCATSSPFSQGLPPLENIDEIEAECKDCPTSLAQAAGMLPAEKRALLLSLGVPPQWMAMFLRSLQDMIAQSALPKARPESSDPKEAVAFTANAWDPYSETRLVSLGAYTPRTWLPRYLGKDGGRDNDNGSATRREELGAVGIRNQGATCYLNSLLQALFHLTAFRTAIYAMPYDGQSPQKRKSLGGPGSGSSSAVDSATASAAASPSHPQQSQGGVSTIPRALQRLFVELDTSEHPVSTTDLTASFGWSQQDAYVQQDIHELTSILLDNLERKMRAAGQSNKVEALFKGDFHNFVRIPEVGHESLNREAFYDFECQVKNCPTIYHSLDKLFAVETLDGSNKYCYEHPDGRKTYHPAQMGKKIGDQLPPVLMVHLNRMDFDYVQGTMSKVLTRWEYYDELDLTRYLPPAEKGEEPFKEVDDDDACEPASVVGAHDGNDDDDNGPQRVDEKAQKDGDEAKKSSTKRKVWNERHPEYRGKYKLHSVVVHSGSDARSGHYYCFSRASGDKWLKFNDEMVEQVTPNQVFGLNFGGDELNYWGSTAPRSIAAYMLVYVRAAEYDTITRKLHRDEIPKELVAAMEEERQQRLREEQDRANDHNKVPIRIVTATHLGMKPWLMFGSYNKDEEKQEGKPGKPGSSCDRVVKGLTLRDIRDITCDRCPSAVETEMVFFTHAPANSGSNGGGNGTSTVGGAHPGHRLMKWVDPTVPLEKVSPWGQSSYAPPLTIYALPRDGDHVEGKYSVLIPSSLEGPASSASASANASQLVDTGTGIPPLVTHHKWYDPRGEGAVFFIGSIIVNVAISPRALAGRVAKLVSRVMPDCIPASVLSAPPSSRRGIINQMIVLLEEQPNGPIEPSNAVPVRSGDIYIWQIKPSLPIEEEDDEEEVDEEAEEEDTKELRQPAEAAADSLENQTATTSKNEDEGEPETDVTSKPTAKHADPNADQNNDDGGEASPSGAKPQAVAQRRVAKRRNAPSRNRFDYAYDYYRFLRHKVTVRLHRNEFRKGNPFVTTFEIADDSTYEEVQRAIAHSAKCEKYENIRLARHNTETGAPSSQRLRIKDCQRLRTMLSWNNQFTGLLYYEELPFSVLQAEANTVLTFEFFSDDVKPVSAHAVLLPKPNTLTMGEVLELCRDAVPSLKHKKKTRQGSDHADSGDDQKRSGADDDDEEEEEEELRPLRLCDVWKGRMYTVYEDPDFVMKEKFEETADYRVEFMPRPGPNIEAIPENRVDVCHCWRAPGPNGVVDPKSAIQCHGDPFSMYLSPDMDLESFQDFVAAKLKMSVESVRHWRVQFLAMKTDPVLFDAEKSDKTILGQLKAFKSRSHNNLGFIGLEHTPLSNTRAGAQKGHEQGVRIHN